MKLTPLQKRAYHKERNTQQLDLNLTALVDVFTILIFFLLSNSTEVEVLPASKAVTLPESTADKAPKATLVVLVSGTDIVVEGRRIALVSEVLANAGDVIAPLQAELELLSTRQVVREENQSGSRAITIMGDKDIPFQLLRKVMATCARANFSDVSFALRQKADA
jgi:biopolymer transport protein ExbD